MSPRVPGPMRRKLKRAARLEYHGYSYKPRAIYGRCRRRWPDIWKDITAPKGRRVKARQVTA